MPTTSSNPIEATLAERNKTYGSFKDNAAEAQRLKDVLHSTPNWWHLEADQREALEIIASKISRILTGDYNHIDSWHDIAGYAKLVDDRLRLEKQDKTMQGSYTAARIQEETDVHRSRS